MDPVRVELTGVHPVTADTLDDLDGTGQPARVVVYVGSVAVLVLPAALVDALVDALIDVDERPVVYRT